MMGAGGSACCLVSSAMRLLHIPAWCRVALLTGLGLGGRCIRRMTMVISSARCSPTLGGMFPCGLNRNRLGRCNGRRMPLRPLAGGGMMLRRAKFPTISPSPRLFGKYSSRSDAMGWKAYIARRVVFVRRFLRMHGSAIRLSFASLIGVHAVADPQRRSSLRENRRRSALTWLSCLRDGVGGDYLGPARVLVVPGRLARLCYDRQSIEPFRLPLSRCPSSPACAALRGFVHSLCARGCLHGPCSRFSGLAVQPVQMQAVQLPRLSAGFLDPGRSLLVPPALRAGGRDRVSPSMAIPSAAPWRGSFAAGVQRLACGRDPCRVYRVRRCSRHHREYPALSAVRPGWRSSDPFPLLQEASAAPAPLQPMLRIPLRVRVLWGVLSHGFSGCWAGLFPAPFLPRSGLLSTGLRRAQLKKVF